MDASAAAEVGRLAGVLFDVRSFDANSATVSQLDVAVFVGRLLVLGGLEVLGHVRVEVVLAGEHRGLNPAVQGPPQGHGELDRLTVRHRKRPRQAEADRADVGVRFVAERVGASAEQLRLGGQLDVHFETDDDLPALGQFAHEASFAAASSSTLAARNMVPSPSMGARIWTPIGSPSSPIPNGTDMAGCPARFDGIVQTSHM